MSAFSVGRFADPKRTQGVELGPCRCPGTPHPGGDSAQVRVEIGDGEIKSAYRMGGFRRVPPVTDAAGRIVVAGQFDNEGADDEAVARFTRSWTFLDEEGDPVPITWASVGLLDSEARGTLVAAVDAVVEALAAGASLPNASAAPSAASPRAKPSRTPTMPSTP